MNYSKLSTQAADTASAVTETVGEAVATGLDRGRELVSTAVDRLPEPATAADWTREHVPGLTRRSRRSRIKSWLPTLAAIAAIAAVIWWLRRDSEPEGDSRPA